MKNIYPLLEAVKSNLESLEIFKSLKIGLERGIKSINTPFCRIVVENIEHKGVRSLVTIQIVIAFDIKNDIEKLYKEFFEVEYKIKNNLFSLPYKVNILNSITDEDRLANLKAGIIRVVLEDISGN